MRVSGPARGIFLATVEDVEHFDLGIIGEVIEIR